MHHMYQKLEERLAALNAEYDKGQNRFRQLEAEMTSLRETLLRISGAIQVLQELLSARSLPVPISGNEANERITDANSTIPA